MRIIAGRYRGHRLFSPAGLAVRPTSDRVRETLFAVLGSAVVDARFLDLFAGSGAVGLEALSGGRAMQFLRSIAAGGTGDQAKPPGNRLMPRSIDLPPKFF
jgi:16S rRNA (guanine(966)-N(2))-methyltransferase RsmD